MLCLKFLILFALYHSKLGIQSHFCIIYNYFISSMGGHNHRLKVQLNLSLDSDFSNS